MYTHVVVVGAAYDVIIDTIVLIDMTIISYVSFAFVVVVVVVVIVVAIVNRQIFEIVSISIAIYDCIICISR